MKRIRYPRSLREQFPLLLLPPSTSARAGLPPHLARPLSTTTTARTSAIPQPHKGAHARTEKPPPPPPPCRSPTTSAKLAALHARLSLHPDFPLQTLARALIHPSAEPHPLHHNGALGTLGGALMGYYATEHLLCAYPRLPTVVLGAGIAALVGRTALAAVGREWGVEAAFEAKADVDAGLLQFARLPAGAPAPPDQLQRSERPGPVGEEEAMASFVGSVFGGVYLHEGTVGVRQFFRQHVLSRRLEVERLFEFVQPTRELSRLCAREGFEPPVARRISETGRKSIAPVFVVGVYSGLEKIGEGHGGSVDEARIRAAVNALKGWYLYRPATRADLPSKTDEDPEASFSPAMIDVGEVVV